MYYRATHGAPYSGLRNGSRSGPGLVALGFMTAALVLHHPRGAYAADETSRGPSASTGSGASASENAASLTIEVTEPGAIVVLDGRYVGIAPLGNAISVEAGSHRIEVTKPGFEPARRELVLPVHSATTLTLSLALRPELGELVVAGSVPAPDATLFIDGRNAGPLPWTGKLPPGEHELSLQSPRLSAEPQRVRVDSRGSTRITLLLTPLPGNLRVTARREDALIRLDGRLVAEGSFAGEIPAGAHLLEVSPPQSATWRKPITLQPGERLVLSEVDPLPVDGADESDRDRFSGLYGALGIFGLYGPQPGHGLFDCGPATVNASCSVTPNYGGGLLIQAGYAFLSGLVAPELFVLAPADVSHATVRYPEAVAVEDSPYGGVQREEQYVFLRYGAGVGASVRTTTVGDGARLTGALGFGVIARRMQYQYLAIAETTVPDEYDFRTDTAAYMAPILMGDVGVLLGSTPGLKLYVGAQMMLEFQRRQSAPGRRGEVGFETDISSLSVVRQPLRVPELTLADKPQFFAGPVLSLRAGS